MTIGTSLFSTLAVRGFGRLQGEISSLHGRVSSGVNNPRASADLMRASQLSAVTEQRAMLTQYASNAASAGDRLGHTDLAMGDASTINRQLKDIALQAANATLVGEGRAGLRAEALSLRDALVSIANRSDTLGQGLFSGYAREGAAFVDGAGGVTFAGDAGRTTTRVSEATSLRTGLNGADVFMAVPTDGGPRSVFEMVDDLIATLSTPLGASEPIADATMSARLTVPLDRQPRTLTFTLTGPLGSAEIAVEMVKGVPGPMVDAIEAASAQTGIRATLATDGESYLLASAGGIQIADLSRRDAGRVPLAELTALDPAGNPTGPAVALRAAALSADRMVSVFERAIGHFAEQRAEAGSLAAMADRHAQSTADRRVQIDQAVSQLEELDIAGAMTRLQTLLLTQQASQQTYAKIMGGSLFDYLR